VRGISSVREHVIAREFFTTRDRQNDLPCVPACAECNTKKSALESYVTATFLAGTMHESADEHYALIRPRLERNKKARNQVLTGATLTHVLSNGIFIPMFKVRLDRQPIDSLHRYITRGLFYFHFREALPADSRIKVRMPTVDASAVALAHALPLLNEGKDEVNGNLGRQTFLYSGIRSHLAPQFSMWRMAWHNGIRLYGDNSPPEGLAIFESITFPAQHTAPSI